MFNIGDRVRKLKGYRYPGIIVSVFKNLAGETRFVVESSIPGAEGWLHIFNGDQLEPINLK